ncbi:hypothetical protein TWF225_003012 [Orbilia oligospora]|nr:hypothetical protein TWF225_003012 [Orbilia oligospora]KAF3267970.1 hypothetical protein TWF217_011690 [Orbilia oligospora]KAF3269701.1 hypothetical protein TWF128_005888 [Orbilia oligospora]
MSTTSLPTATRRLLRDLSELRSSPVSTNVTAHPLDSDIYQWHGNLHLSLPNHTFTLHFSMLFPSNYPSHPPSLLLLTRLPHENLLTAVGGYKVCLDMLDESIDGEYKGWSQSYSVRSILMQLEAFLTDEGELVNVRLGSLDDAQRDAGVFECKKCGSCRRKVWPRFPTEEEVERKVVREVKRPKIVRSAKVVKKAVVGSEGKGKDGDGWTSVSKKVPQVDEVPVAKKKKPAGPDFSKAAGKVMVIKPGHQIKRAPKLIALKDLESIRVAKPTESRPASLDDEVEDSPRELHYKRIERHNAGLFSTLPYEMMLQILLSGGLSAKDILNLSMTCKHINSFCMDGYFWKSFFQRCYPNSDLVASNLDDWLLAFAQETNFAGSEMKCFASKVGMDEDVLGVPIDWTVNPKTKCVDYIYIVDSSDFLSRSSFHDDRVRKTTWNKEFKSWCPMYLTEEHFQRALPDIKEFMVEMCPEYGTRLFQPRMVLDVIPKMMNTLVVLLMDNGEKISSKAIEGYFLLHRLFRALLVEFPQLQKEVDERIRRVKESEESRTKSVLPNFGNFLPLLSVSEKYTWTTPGLSRAIIGEFFDRQVIWTAREHSKIVNVQKFAPTNIDANDKYLGLWLSVGQVSRRLMVFHVRLLYMIQQKNGGYMDEISTANDLLYGRPPRQVVEKFQRTVQKIMTLESWPDFFDGMFVRQPTRAALTGVLQQAVRNSLRKRYHRAGMDFSKIHASGVSRILLKGQSYSVPPNLKKLEMKESWRWDSNSGSNFLDATCTVFDFKDQMIDEVSYMSRIAFCSDENNRNKSAALRHSGDQMDHTISRGEHTIEIDLEKIGKVKEVKSLVFCMSAWSGAHLRDFKSPEVALVDKVSKVEMATYNFGSTRGGEIGGKKSVVMAVLYRSKFGDKWDLKAVGDIGSGDLTRADVLREEMERSLRKI